MLKCNIVTDLLPSYIDDVLSEETVREVELHLQNCTDCNTVYMKMNAPIDIPITLKTKGEIDYLKKIKRNTIKKIFIACTSLIIVFAVLTYIFYIGSPINSKDLIYEIYIDDKDWCIDFELKNGNELLVRISDIYGEADSDGIKSIVGFTLTPYEVAPSFIIDGHGNTYNYGVSLNTFENNEDFTIILRLNDREVVVTKENYLQMITED